ncbi:MAG: hypothetical protein M1451_06995 [Acidobacteria bacterium]|nr:hypothetical protein [Acidobacteriota bacterium]
MTAARVETQPARSKARQADPSIGDLEHRARALKQKDTPANYRALATYVNAWARYPFDHPLGQRAALALAFRDINMKKPADARRWLDIAERDAVLREYALYWRAQLERAIGSNSKALALFAKHREEFPESVMSPQAVIAVAELSLAANDAPRALAALDSYGKTASRNDTLLLRARARESAGQRLAAAADYLSIYYQQDRKSVV